MHRVLFTLIATATALGGVAAIEAPAHAGATGVTLRTIADRQVGYGGGRTVVEASYTTTGAVKISSTAVTVRTSSETIATSVRQVELGAGTYTVGQRVSYRVKQRGGSYGPVKNVRATQTLQITERAQDCATANDVFTVLTTGDDGESPEGVDDSAAVSVKLFSSGRRYAPAATLYQRLQQAVDPVQIDRWQYLNFVFGGGSVYIEKVYRACDPNDIAWVEFVEGKALNAGYVEDYRRS